MLLDRDEGENGKVTRNQALQRFVHEFQHYLHRDVEVRSHAQGVSIIGGQNLSALRRVSFLNLRLDQALEYFWCACIGLKQIVSKNLKGLV